MGVSKPRSGTKQFWPRVRSKRIYARVKSWFNAKDANLLGFAGYKVGMTHVILKDNRPNSMSKGSDISWPVTIVECPPLKILSVRFYKKEGYGFSSIGEVMVSNVEKSLARKLDLPKKKEGMKKLEDFANRLDEVADIRVQVYTQPRKAGIGKKTPEIFELGIGGEIAAKFNFVKENMNKEFKVSDVLKAGMKIDLHGITKGKGFQGLIKRFGVGLRHHKSEKAIRSAVMGAVHPGRVLPGHKMPGQMGYHQRTEYNKDLVFIGNNVTKVNSKAGYAHYGELKSDYVLIRGSVMGPAKRLIILTQTIRGIKGLGDQVQLQNICVETKQ